MTAVSTTSLSTSSSTLKLKPVNLVTVLMLAPDSSTVHSTKEYVTVTPELLGTNVKSERAGVVLGPSGLSA